MNIEPDNTKSEDPFLSIVLLAYNEEENVEAVMSELLEWLSAQPWTAEVIFVDDGSTDATRREAQRILAGRRAHIHAHRVNRGIGAALKTGVREARGRWVTFLPCDGQIPPAAVGTLVAATQPPGDLPDLVLSTYEGRSDGAHRQLLSWGVRTLIRVVHGVRVQSDGPYLFRRGLFVPEELPPDSFFLNFEFPIRAVAAGLTVRTVTIPCRRRRAGASKVVALRRVGAVAEDLFALRLRRSRDALARALGRAL